MPWPPPQANATSPNQPPAAGAPVARPDSKVLVQRQLDTLVGAMNTAVGRLVATSAVSPDVLTATTRKHAAMLDYAVQLQKRLDTIGNVDGEMLGLQREASNFQSDVEALINAIDAELRGAGMGRALSGLGEGETSPGWMRGATYGLLALGTGVAAWWFFRRRRITAAG